MSVLYLVLDVIAFALVFFLFFICVKNYAKLPQVIPTHFDPELQPDAFGHKRWIFLYPVLGLIFFVGFYFILQDPEGMNYPVEITEENKDRQFSTALISMRILLVIVLLVFLNIADLSVRKALDAEAKPVASFADMILSVLLFTGITIFISSILK